MLNMQEWMALVNYKITEGSKYGWSCYGPNSYSLDSWDGKYGDCGGGYSFSVIFSTKSQKVYEVNVCDYANNRAYRMINPKNVEKHRKEAESRGSNLNEAYAGVEYVDLQVDDDFIQKGLAIISGEDYDTGILVSIDLPDDILLYAALEAHKRNITFNEYINMVLRSLTEKIDSDKIIKESELDPTHNRGEEK